MSLGYSPTEGCPAQKTDIFCFFVDRAEFLTNDIGNKTKKRVLLYQLTLSMTYISNKFVSNDTSSRTNPDPLGFCDSQKRENTKEISFLSLVPFCRRISQRHKPVPAGYFIGKIHLEMHHVPHLLLEFKILQKHALVF